MKKAIIEIIFTSVFLLSYLQETSAQNWFPLEVGNKWQYLVRESSGWIYNTTIKYSLQEYSVINDTSINQRSYFRFSRFPNAWIRFDTTYQQLYQFCDSTDMIIMDFTLPVDSFDFFSKYSCSDEYCIIIEDNLNFGDSIIYAKGFWWFIYGISSCDYNEYFSIGLGPTNNGFGCQSMGGFFDSESNSILQANINNINYAYNYNPEIVIEPISAINDSSFSLTFEVKHPYNHIFPEPTPNTSLNFINTVKMHSFYSKGGAILDNPIVFAESISGTADWEINTLLNMDLMWDDYKFNYKIEAIDKGLVPHRSFAPDTGYFVAVYDTTTGVNEIGEPLRTFKLYQNYPNPFNPRTSIQYAIGSRQIITLKVYDILGNEIATLVNEEKPAGEYEVEFDASSGIRNLVSGIYFYQLKAGNFVETKKMILLK